MPRLELEITEALDGRTVRSLLRGELSLSAGCVGRLKRAEGGITVGGVRVFTNAVLQTGDTLTVDLDAAERPTAVEPVPMELDIAFEDEHLLILNKAAPLAVSSAFPPPMPKIMSTSSSRAYSAQRSICAPVQSSPNSTAWTIFRPLSSRASLSLGSPAAMARRPPITSALDPKGLHSSGTWR